MKKTSKLVVSAVIATVAIMFALAMVTVASAQYVSAYTDPNQRNPIGDPGVRNPIGDPGVRNPIGDPGVRN